MPTQRISRSSPRGRKQRRPLVLVVDDSDDVREIYVAYLTFSGFRAVEAADGVEAIAKAEACRPDAVVLDLSLPQMGGLDVARRLRAKGKTKTVFIVVLTGYAEPELKRRAEEVGCDAFLTKPCLPQQLVRVLLTGLARET